MLTRKVIMYSGNSNRLTNPLVSIDSSYVQFIFIRILKTFDSGYIVDRSIRRFIIGYLCVHPCFSARAEKAITSHLTNFEETSITFKPLSMGDSLEEV